MAVDTAIAKVRKAWSDRTHRAYRDRLRLAAKFIRAFAYGDVSPMHAAALRIAAEEWLAEYEDYLGEDTSNGEEASY